MFAVLLLASAVNAATPGHATLIAHKGESWEAPANTMPAFRLAVERGFGFECDIRLSKDGRIFTYHNIDFGQVTNGANTNRCDDLTWDEISRIDVGRWGRWKNSKRFAGTRPALLEEVLSLVRESRCI